MISSRKSKVKVLMVFKLPPLLHSIEYGHEKTAAATTTSTTATSTKTTAENTIKYCIFCPSGFYFIYWVFFYPPIKKYHIFIIFGLKHWICKIPIIRHCRYSSSAHRSKELWWSVNVLANFHTSTLNYQIIYSCHISKRISYVKCTTIKKALCFNWQNM